ncbi:MAG TPA: MmcQ/YjbR family DNA-binding protein [Thermoanaerobaculia bacterium]|nr:MmcQ/YjbR family DNA-binding protein [Thermoanaerobaculia bacterium]
MAKKKATAASIDSELREFALAYPETHEDFPWGERAIKVKGKVFIFMRTTENELSFSVKLPNSRDIALDLPWTEPTHYGMGKHGWVTAKVDPKDAPLDMIKAWIDESFRAVAPKTLVKKMDAAR